MRRSLLLPCFALLLTGGCENLEVTERRYETMQAAVEAGEVTRGWLPAWLPAGARGIRIASEADTNESWISLELESAARPLLLSRCRPAPGPRELLARKRGASWWPDDLVRKDGDAAASRFAVYSCEDGFRAAIDDGGSRVLLWTGAS